MTDERMTHAELVEEVRKLKAELKEVVDLLERDRKERVQPITPVEWVYTKPQ